MEARKQSVGCVCVVCSFLSDRAPSYPARVPGDLYILQRPRDGETSLHALARACTRLSYAVRDETLEQEAAYDETTMFANGVLSIRYLFVCLFHPWHKTCERGACGVWNNPAVLVRKQPICGFSVGSRPPPSSACRSKLPSKGASARVPHRWVVEARPQRRQQSHPKGMGRPRRSGVPASALISACPSSLIESWTITLVWKRC